MTRLFSINMCLHRELRTTLTTSLKNHRHLELNGSLEMIKSLLFIVFEKQISEELKQISKKKKITQMIHKSDKT